jgi:hypothetical protein
MKLICHAASSDPRGSWATLSLQPGTGSVKGEPPASCLEFFNILRDQWPVKYVVPCIGAVKFADLPMNHCFEIRTQETQE